MGAPQVDRTETGGLLARRYLLLDELGRGCTGIVYRVADTLDDGRILALKTLRPEAASPAAREQLRDEARVKATLLHPNTVAVLDFGELEDSRPYLLMEHVAGQGLERLVASGPMEIDQACSLLAQLLLALGFLHDRHFVHRDIKPDNVRVTADGRLKLMDFGLMQPLGSPSSGKLAGTIGYIAPEVVLGGALDARSDLYSAGALAFELLTGSSAFADDPELGVRGYSARRPPSPRALRPELPVPLERLVLRLLEPDPARRFSSADRALAALASLRGYARAADIDHKRCYLATRQLVGREREHELLRGRLRRAMEGEAASVFLTASGGVGKSRLAHELTLEARLAGFRLLKAAGLEHSTGPFALLARLLSPLSALAAPEDLARLGPLLPGLAAAPVSLAADKHRLHDALCELLETTSRRHPLLLLVEDLQWADLPSVEALNHAIRELRASRLFTLATLRHDETPNGSPVWFTARDGTSELLGLEPFDQRQTALLAANMFPGLRDAARLGQILFRATAGNAFFVTEVLFLLVQEGLLAQDEDGWGFPAELEALGLPASVEATLGRRLSRLGRDERALAETAALIGPSQESWLLAELCGLAPERLHAGLRELLSRQVLVEEPAGYAFAQDQLREALYREIDEPRRRELHQRCAERLERHARERGEDLTARLAHHYALGLDRRQAHLWCARAGDQAHRSGHDELAVAWWSHAVQALEGLDLEREEELRFELRWKIGTCGYVAAPALATDALERCVEALEAEGDIALVSRLFRLAKRLSLGRRRGFREIPPYVFRRRRGPASLLPPRPVLGWFVQLMQARVMLCTAAANAGRIELAMSAGERALELLSERDGPFEGIVQVGLASCHYMAGRVDLTTAAAARARQLFSDDSLPPWLLQFRVAAGFVAASTAFQGIRPDQQWIEECFALAERLDLQHLRNQGFAGMAYWYAVTGRHREAMALLEAAARNCREAGNHQYMSYVLRPLLHLNRGEWDKAYAVIRQALRPDPSERFPLRMLIEAMHGLALHRLGRSEEAEAVLLQAREQSERSGTFVGLLAIDLALAMLELWRGALDRSEARALQVWAQAAAGPTRNPLHQALAARILGGIHRTRAAALAPGEQRAAQRAAARGRFEEALAIVARPEQDNLLEQGRLHRLLGELDASEDALDDARRHLERARELFASIDNRHELHETERAASLLAAEPPVPPQAPAQRRPTTQTVEES